MAAAGRGYVKMQKNEMFMGRVTIPRIEKIE
jgi:hypothetical protein